jgi:PKD repeat protein
LFAGESTGPQALEALEVPASGASWSATFGGLAPGTYTAQATQHDAAGNTGTSGAVTFAIVAAPSASPPPPPVASFSWIPAAPRTGESVSFVSSSTDAGSPITGFAWSLTAAGSFSPGKPVLATSFATPGSHVVRLLVTDAGGRTSLATQTVPVGESSHPLMQPFPIVRIVGSVTSFGARVRLLSVQAPLSAQVLVTCKGRGCKTKSESRFASASSATKGKPGAVTLAFQHFERSLRAGVVLQIRVSKPGEIGKFTSFTIRRNRPPTRTDRCLMPTTSTPILCPST